MEPLQDPDVNSHDDARHRLACAHRFLSDARNRLAAAKIVARQAHDRALKVEARMLVIRRRAT